MWTKGLKRLKNFLITSSYRISKKMAKMMNLINMMAIIIIIFNNIKIILSIEGSGMPLKREENPGYKEKLGLLKKVGKIEVKKGMENTIMSI